VTSPFGVYVHVPFCRHRCDYCAFATYTDRDHLMEAYVHALGEELRRGIDDGGIPPASSVFVGGGTPSRLPADWLASVLVAIPRQPGAEVTVECNPEDVTEALLATYRSAGVTRVSLGVQSTVPHVLEGLGRRHGPPQVNSAAELVASAGFASWNMDLIMGGAGERKEDWQQSLDEVLGLPDPPPHISAYALTVEPGTPLSRSPDRHPDDDQQADRYEWADARLAEAGYRWEEISNWARPGHECRHNHLYWSQGNYRGLGSAAHSHQDGRRWWNVRTPDRYVALVHSGASPVAAEERLDESQRRFERLALLLRTPAGVPAEALSGDLDDLVTIEAGRAVLTRRGRLLANAVSARLVDPGSSASGPVDAPT
jgi:oxygen-independent coproporphyrinogen-3 oxidase